MKKPKHKIKFRGKEYRLMKIGLPVNPASDIILNGSWYTLDPRKEAELDIQA